MTDDKLYNTLAKLESADDGNKEVLREIILQYQKHDIKACPNFYQIMYILLKRFGTNFETESHILIMNAVCALLNSLVKNDDIEVFKFINTILNIHTQDNQHLFEFELSLSCNTKNAVQLYFIESLLKGNVLNHDQITNSRMDLLLEMFNATEKSCMSCEKSSFVGFRGMYEIVKCFTKYDYWRYLENSHISRILLIVNSNWDNSVTGVRENNCKILQETLKNIDRLCIPEILPTFIQATLKNLSWLNKSKYFILIELFKTCRSNDYVIDQLLQNCVLDQSKDLKSFCDGLLSSLINGGVTSAGAALFVEIWMITSTREYLQEQILLTLKNSPMNVVQNLYNYWLPHIAKVSPEILLNFCDELRNSQQWFSLISIMTLCRKHGLISLQEDDLKTIKFLNNCSINSNESLRSLSFQFLCISPKTYISPVALEYEMLKKFLFCNVNSDCTYLRQSIVTNFTLFIIRIRDSSLNNLKILQKINCKSNISINDDDKKQIEADLFAMSEFISWMHEFLISNLHPEANYQRKYLSLMLYDTILRYLNGGTESIENKRKGLCRKGHLKSQGVKIRDYLLESDKWKYTEQKSLQTLLACVSDATNDVRELAMNILKEYFIYNDFNDAKQLILIALEMCNSTTFHETECGALYIVLFLNLQKQDELQIIFNDFIHAEGDNLHTIVKCLTKIIEEQYLAFKLDCVNAIMCHKPMYGILTTLKFILSKCLMDKSMLSQNDVVDLLHMIEKISNFCLESLALKAAKTEFTVAPSFSEMDDSITHLILSSNMKLNETVNFHQDVFNCLWMSLRLCANISSSLGILLSSTSEYLNSFNHDQNRIVSQCAKIIVSTLTRCRHKGVIEGAGVSLANLIRHITKTVPSSSLADDILEKHILSTLCATYKGPSMTRRGAGMGILFHKLISSDSRDNKPLLKSAMSSLLKLLQNDKQIQTNNDSEVNDIIEASVLHYIKGLVQDSSLKNDLAPYMSELTLLAFKYFFDPSWPVRNAALQLFGAIVPKLIGQKKGMINNLEENLELQPCEGMLHVKMDYLFVDIGELFQHYPELAARIQGILKEKIALTNNGNIMEIHASLVPVLSLLSGTIVGLSMLYSDKLTSLIQDLQHNSKLLLSSPIHVLRNLSAKVYTCLTPLPDIEQKILTVCEEIVAIHTENYRHGCLLALSYLVDKFLTQGKHMFNKDTSINIAGGIFEVYRKLICDMTYYNQAMCFNLMCSVNHCDIDISWIKAYERSLKTAISSKEHDPGLSLFVQNLTRHTISYCDVNDLLDILRIIVTNFKCVDSIKSCFTYLSKRISTLNDKQGGINEASEMIFNLLLDFLLKYHDSLSSDIICLALQLMQQTTKPDINCNMKTIKNFFEIFIEYKTFSVTICSSALAIISSVLFVKYCSLLEFEQEYCEFVKLIINVVCDCATFCSEDVRVNVVRSLNSLVLILHKNCRALGMFAEGESCFAVKKRCVDTIINLFQDENSYIRNEMTKFFIYNIGYDALSINPTACLLMFLNSTFLSDIFQNRNLYLSEKLQALQFNQTDDHSKETLQYIPNVFYEKFFIEKMIHQCINISVPVYYNGNSNLNINNDFLKMVPDQYAYAFGPK